MVREKCFGHVNISESVLLCIRYFELWLGLVVTVGRDQRYSRSDPVSSTGSS